jgi:hypothetical protein
LQTALAGSLAAQRAQMGAAPAAAESDDGWSD